MSKHTPGPWKAVNQTTSTLLKQDSPQGRYLFSLKEYPGIPESEANARLIAAAPDLLAFVEEVVRTYEGFSYPPRMADEARALLAKVRG